MSLAAQSSAFPSRNGLLPYPGRIVLFFPRIVSFSPPERTDPSPAAIPQWSLAFLLPSYSFLLTIEFFATIPGRMLSPTYPRDDHSLLLRVRHSLVLCSRQNCLVYPSPRQTELAPSRAPSAGSRRPALRATLTGSLATVKRRSPSRLYLICVMDRSWPCSRIGFCGNRTRVSAPKIGPCPSPGPRR